MIAYIISANAIHDQFFKSSSFIFLYMFFVCLLLGLMQWRKCNGIHVVPDTLGFAKTMFAGKSDHS